MESIRENPKCDRDVTVYGYLRGANMRQGTRVHLAGVGDQSVRPLCRPQATPCCPLQCQLLLTPFIISGSGVRAHLVRPPLLAAQALSSHHLLMAHSVCLHQWWGATAGCSLP